MFQKLAAVTLVLACAQFAHASQVTLGLASGYNVFTFSNFTPTGADTLGKVAVGGNFSGSNYLVGSALHDSGSTLDFVVAGSLTDSGFSSTGGAIWAGSATISSASLANVYSKTTFSGSGLSSSGTVYSGAYNGPSYVTHAAFTNTANPWQSTPIDFVSAQTSLGTSVNGLSTQLASLATTGTTAVQPNNGLVLTGTNSAQNVFNLTAAQLSSALSSGSSGVSISAPSGSIVVVNVSGSSINISSSSLNLSGVSASQVLFNFNQATAISYGGVGLTASFLAPIATFTGTGGNLNGELIANAVTGNTEFHNDYIFSGSLNVISVTATPEPSTWMMSLTGICFFGFLIRRRLRSGVSSED